MAKGCGAAQPWLTALQSTRGGCGGTNLLPFLSCTIAQEPTVTTVRTQGSRSTLPFNSRRANPRSYAYVLRRCSLASGRRTDRCFDTGAGPDNGRNGTWKAAPQTGYGAPQWSEWLTTIVSTGKRLIHAHHSWAWMNRLASRASKRFGCRWIPRLSRAWGAPRLRKACLGLGYRRSRRWVARKDASSSCSAQIMICTRRMVEGPIHHCQASRIVSVAPANFSE